MASIYICLIELIYDVYFYFAANMDYIPVSKTLYFSPGVRTQTVNIVILDDLGQPAREGLEYFELALVLPISTRAAVPERALVVINDTHSDCKYIFAFHPHFVMDFKGVHI